MTASLASANKKLFEKCSEVTVLIVDLGRFFFSSRRKMKNSPLSTYGPYSPEFYDMIICECNWKKREMNENNARKSKKKTHIGLSPKNWYPHLPQGKANSSWKSCLVKWYYPHYRSKQKKVLLGTGGYHVAISRYRRSTIWLRSSELMLAFSAEIVDLWQNYWHSSSYWWVTRHQNDWVQTWSSMIFFKFKVRS